MVRTSSSWLSFPYSRKPVFSERGALFLQDTEQTSYPHILVRRLSENRAHLVERHEAGVLLNTRARTSATTFHYLAYEVACDLVGVLLELLPL